MTEFSGVVRKDRRTKNLVKRLKPHEIALIAHADLDEVAAQSLVAARVRAVLNVSQSITGRYPNKGPLILAEADIPVFDLENPAAWDLIPDGARVVVKDGSVFYGGKNVARGQLLTRELIHDRLEKARENLAQELDQFVENTLEYARREKGLILGSVSWPALRARIAGRQALVVVRGAEYEQDLRALQSYIDEVHPVLIAVDGGADCLLEHGLHPDIIVGDMDSVSDRALRSRAELIVHAYQDGRAPGLARVKELGLEAHVVPLPGTSEDLALLLAYEKGASLIVAVGAHSNMIDFLEKGRRGMASTFLVRLKVGSILVDAKGVNKLYRGRMRGRYLAIVALAAAIPTALIIGLSEPVRELARLVVMWVRLNLRIL